MNYIKEISLTPVIANAINQPRYTHKDGDYPLYPHSEDSKITLNRPSNWHKSALTTYNSPSNIRTLCLSIDGANMYYWAPPIKHKRPASQVLSGDYTLDKSGKSGVKQKLDPSRYAHSNTGLQALVNPVVLSNIEELWITSELLNTPRYQQYYNQISNLNPGQVAGVEFLSAILEAEISTPSKPRTIADTFPLLRAIVVVKLSPNSPTLDFHKLATRDPRLKDLYPSERRAVGEVPQLLEELAKNSGVSIVAQPILTGNITKFSIGSYKYDAEVLSAVRDKIVRKYTPKKVESTQETSTNSTNPTITEEPKKSEPAQVNPTPQEDEESLVDVIKSLEKTSSDPSAIKMVLFVLKQTRADYFARQIPLLPETMRTKYKDALQ